MSKKATPISLSLKYELYEASVQEADADAAFFADAFEELQGKPALSLREDFCGTHWLCCEWVKGHPERTALGIDLSSEPIAYGKTHHENSLDSQQKKRVRTLIQNVKKVTKDKFDLIVASNFSYFIFKQRSEMLQYFKSVRRSINPGGMFVFDHFGGPASGEVGEESRKIKSKSGRFRYIWEAERANLFTGEALFHIHFKDEKSGHLYKNAFSYDWRLWTVPELQDIAREAGFSRIDIYKDMDGEYKLQTAHEEDDDSWLLQIAARP